MINYYHDYLEYAYEYIRILNQEFNGFFALVTNIQIPKRIHVTISKSKSTFMLRYINLLKR